MAPPSWYTPHTQCRYSGFNIRFFDNGAQNAGIGYGSIWNQGSGDWCAYTKTQFIDVTDAKCDKTNVTFAVSFAPGSGGSCNDYDGGVNLYTKI